MKVSYPSQICFAVILVVMRPLCNFSFEQNRTRDTTLLQQDRSRPRILGGYCTGSILLVCY
uniref:Uncharacterized protein n=1 Tax=Arundo donax TaxID=35708 RepID=A0A0A8Z3P7_ARUDO